MGLDRGDPRGAIAADRPYEDEEKAFNWDEVMLAPKERDFIFIREPQADAFWEGYGQREIDWMLLSYYLWERVVQDVIEDAQNVCFRDDLAEETRADVARLFHESLAEGGNNIAAAYAAAAHLTI